MKLTHVVMAGACALLILPACNNDKGKPISQLNGLNTGDSISYYLGESLAGQYYQYAHQDSTLGGQAARGEFLEGFLDAQEMANSDSEAYKRGFMMGVQSIGMFSQMQKNWDVKINPNYLRQGFNYASKSDSVIDQSKAQQALNIIGARMEAKRRAQSEADAKNAVNEAAKKLGGFKDMGENVMMKITKTVASGENFKNGDAVEFAMLVKNAKGEDVSMLSNPKAQGEIGKNFPVESAMTKVIMSMKPGEEATLLIPSELLLGGRADQFGYTSKDVFTVTLKPVRPTAQPQENK